MRYSVLCVTTTEGGCIEEILHENIKKKKAFNKIDEYEHNDARLGWYNCSYYVIVNE